MVSMATTQVTQLPTGVALRSDLRAGDIGAIVRLHGSLYAAEQGLDERFEAGIGSGIAAAVENGWPGRGALRIAELHGRFAGSVALTVEGPAEGRLRWVVLDPALRGHGLGRRMVSEVVAEGDALGLELIDLQTFSDLQTAGGIYRSLGFEVVETRRFSGWGRPILLQRYERRSQS
jgi:ribosomal protein S18 acetylase RimI-like enzyme